MNFDVQYSHSSHDGMKLQILHHLCRPLFLYGEKLFETRFSFKEGRRPAQVWYA